MTIAKKLCRITSSSFVYLFLAILVLMSILPFFVMAINATRSTHEIWSSAISLVPSTNLYVNYEVLTGRLFNPFVGMTNSAIVSTSATFLAVYFSTLTAFALVAYNWKFRKPFFTLIMAVMMIPATVGSIGFLHFMFRIGWNNNLIALIIPAISAPAAVFFIRQYMIGAFPLEMLEAARIDGSSEFRSFNQVVIPMMKPAMATQAIFIFVGTWNNLFIPSIILTNSDVMTLPIMISLLRGDIYRVELGAIYLALSITVLPLLIAYLIFSKYIVAGIAIGSVKG